MRKIFILILMAFVVSSFAVNINQYKFNTSESVTYQDISVEDKNYQIVSIDGDDTFLYNKDDDQLVTDKDQISSIMKKYYIETYMVKDSDITDILGYMDIFDASRNNGERRANVEEYACRNLLAVGLSGKLNGDPDANLDLINSNINRISIYISNDWLGGGDYADPEKLKPQLTKFFNSSFMIDKDIASIKDSLDPEEISEEDAYSRLSDAKETIDDIYPLETNLEKTIFRSPKTYAECKDCLGICYYIEMNQSALDEAKSIVEDSLEDVSKIENADEIGQTISEKTNERLEYVKKNDEKTYYSTRITSLQSYWDSVKGDMNQSMKLVSDPYIIDTMGQINANISGMTTSVNSLSFDGIEQKYNSTKASIEALKARSIENVALFDRLVNASAQADMVAILSKNATLISQKDELDALFTKPVRYENAVMLLDNYTIIANTVLVGNGTINVTLDALLSQSDRNSILAAKVINGFYSPLTMMDRNAIKPYDSYLVLAAPILIGISICSLVLFFALGGYGKISNAGVSKKRVMIYTMAPALVIMLGLFLSSMAMYLFTPGIGESSGPAMFMEYSKGKPVFIIMKTVNQDSAMARCGHDLKETMEGEGYKVYRAFDYGSKCIIEGKEQAGSCSDAIKDATILMSDGKGSVKSNTFIRPVLEISGSSDDFTKCAIEKIYANSK